MGRQLEQSVLHDALKRVTGGETRVVLLTGELGIGKSRLWEVWLNSLEPAPFQKRRPTVLQTRCLDTAQTLPLAPITALFRQSINMASLLTSPSSLSPIWLAELAHLLPEMQQEQLEIPPAINLPADQKRLHLLEALTQALQSVKGQPLILFVDDLHWADQTTLDWLVYLVDRMHSDQFLLVAAYRPGDASARLVQQIAQWQRKGIIYSLPLPPLTLAEATELMESDSGSGELENHSRIKQLHDQSGGNPYFLHELQRAPSGETPSVLADLVQARLEYLSETGLQVLQAAAVLESEIDFEILYRISEHNEEESLNALDLLTSGGFLVEQPSLKHDALYSFAHPLVRSVIYDGLSVPRRRLLHRRAAHALQSIYVQDETGVVDQLAIHYAQTARNAEEIVQAAHYADLAAQRAQALTGPREAVGFYRQAIALESTPARQMGLGQALLDSGDLNGARQVWQEAATAFEKVGDQTGVARAYGTLAGSYMASGEGTQVVAWAKCALLAAETAADPAAISQAHIFLTSGSMLLDCSLVTVEDHLIQAIHIATDNNLPEIAAQGQLMLGNLLAEKGNLAQALQAHKVGLALIQKTGNQNVEIFAHNSVAYHALLNDDLDIAHAHIENGLALTEEYYLIWPRQFLYSTRGEIALAEDELDEADLWLGQALSEAQKGGNQPHVANIYAKQGLVARARGDLDRALFLLRDADKALATGTATHLQTQIDLWLAELYLLQDKQSKAEESLLRAEARLCDSARQALQAWASQVRAGIR